VISLSYDQKPGELELGDRVILEAGAHLKVHGGSIKLGEQVFIGVHDVLQGLGGISIGPWTMLGPHVLIFSSDHDLASGAEYYMQAPELPGPISIGKNVWIAAGSTVLRGTTIGDGSVIAAGSLVKGDVGPNELVGSKAVLATKVRNIP
jgi:acetyltransferase-like isoleucine patch superfamily enzyme